jgi:hypothetical protein
MQFPWTGTPPFPQLTDEFRDGASIFDMIIGNMDRHGGNMLVQIPHDIMQKIKAGTLSIPDVAAMKDPLNGWLIDHGYTFGLPVGWSRGQMPGPLGETKLINSNVLTKWWYSAPSVNRTFVRSDLASWGDPLTMTKDSADKWIATLVDSKPQLLTLAQKFGLYPDELGAMETRIKAILTALSIGRLRELFVKLMVHP